MTENDLLLQTALAYAKRFGWPVFPLAPGAKVPPQGSHSFKDASTDPEKIRRGWARWPGANIGLACGAAGLVAIDLDVKGAVDGPGAVNGLETWRRLVEAHGIDDATLTSRTPSGGRHLLYRCPPGIEIGNSAGALGPGVDVRGQGGYIVLPPSRLRGGDHPGQYAWQRGDKNRRSAGGTRDAREPAPLPLPLLALLRPPESRIPESRIPEPPTPHQQVYARAALEDELEKLAAAPLGSRNDRLNRAAFCLGQLVGAGLLEAGDTAAKLATVALDIGLGGKEVSATIHSGLEAGAREPRDLPWAGRPCPPKKKPQGGRLDLAPILEAGLAPPLPQDPDDPGQPPQGFPPASGGDAGRGWLDDYIAFSRTWSPRSFDGFHEACALWLLSTIAARRIQIPYGSQRTTSLYLLLAGRTTMHAKSTATGIARALLHDCGLDYLLAPDESTPQSFIRVLAGGDLPDGYAELPAEAQASARMRLGFAGQRGWYAEEFGSWLHSMLRTDGVMADFRGILRKLDDGPNTLSRSTISRGTEEVDRPYLALIANLTPADLQPVAKRGARLWGDGFLARFAFVTPPPDEVLTGRFPRGRRTLPAALIKPLVEWHQRLGLPRVQIQASGDGTLSALIEPPPAQECEPSDEAWEALHRYNAALLQISSDSDLTDLDGNYGRYHDKALRVAALLASLAGDDQIEMGHWARAQAIAERWRTYTHRLYAQVAETGRSPAAEIEDKILAVLERWQGTEKYPRGMTANQIRRFLSGLARTEIARYADEMVRTRVLARVPGKRADRYAIVLPEPHTGEAEGQEATA